MKLRRPFRDRVVIEVIGQSRTKHGLYLPETAQRDKQTAIGRVVAVGEGIRADLRNRRAEGDEHPELDAELIPMDAKIGMTVIFMRYSGVEVTIDNKAFVMVRDHEILGECEEEAANLADGTLADADRVEGRNYRDPARSS